MSQKTKRALNLLRRIAQAQTSDITKNRILDQAKALDEEIDRLENPEAAREEEEAENDDRVV